MARQSVQAAQVKYDAFVVSLAERLQAQTALAQATLDRVRAEGVWETARGLLALAMGLSVDQALGLAAIQDAFPGQTTLLIKSKLLKRHVKPKHEVRLKLSNLVFSLYNKSRI